MGDVALTPYLMFDGECREAVGFYREVLGGELELQTYGEVDPSAAANLKDRVMHSRLSGGRVELMAGDVPGGGPLGTGKVQLALSGTDEQTLRTIFDALSTGGKVGVPLERQMWGDLFGAVSDRYGVDWMVNISTPI
ncbi:MAG: VOC family protein [Trueperaceae bacterium]